MAIHSTDGDLDKVIINLNSEKVIIHVLGLALNWRNCNKDSGLYLPTIALRCEEDNYETMFLLHEIGITGPSKMVDRCDNPLKSSIEGKTSLVLETDSTLVLYMNTKYLGKVPFIDNLSNTSAEDVCNKMMKWVV